MPPQTLSIRRVNGYELPELRRDAEDHQRQDGHAAGRRSCPARAGRIQPSKIVEALRTWRKPMGQLRANRHQRARCCCACRAPDHGRGLVAGRRFTSARAVLPRAVGLRLRGLRRPQIGALHAALAHATRSTEPATIVMPTGTGKTETMLALNALQRFQRLLVVVPQMRCASRSQASSKPSAFSTSRIASTHSPPFSRS